MEIQYSLIHSFIHFLFFFFFNILFLLQHSFSSSTFFLFFFFFFLLSFFLFCLFFSRLWRTCRKDVSVIDRSAQQRPERICLPGSRLVDQRRLVAHLKQLGQHPTQLHGGIELWRDVQSNKPTLPALRLEDQRPQGRTW